MVNKNNKEDKYKMIENFKICAICNKKKDEKNVECDICGNCLHVKCLDLLCTCQKEIRESDLIKKINNCIFINEKINDNYPVKIKKIKLLYPDSDEKENSIVDILNTSPYFLKFSNELVYECDRTLNYYLMEYGIEELDKNDIKVYKKVKKLTNKGQYNYITLTKVRGQGYAVKANTRIKKNIINM